MMHNESHPLAGKIVKVSDKVDHRQYPTLSGSTEFVVEDWWDKLTDGSWMEATGNPACLVYAMRTATQKFRVPVDDEVIYGKHGDMGVLLHVSEIEGIE